MYLENENEPLTVIVTASSSELFQFSIENKTKSAEKPNFGLQGMVRFMIMNWLPMSLVGRYIDTYGFTSRKNSMYVINPHPL
jgi:hypothetical protein